MTHTHLGPMFPGWQEESSPQKELQERYVAHLEDVLVSASAFYHTVEPHRFETAAREAAIGKIEREHFEFPDFGVWLLERSSPHS